MLSEDFDNKIKEAADHHHPAYDEKAWGKMEKLLDKHLPEEKDDRRRIIFFLLLFLLLGSSTWLIVSKPWQENKQESGIVQSSPMKGATERSTTTTANQNSGIPGGHHSTEISIDATPENKNDVSSSSNQISKETIPFAINKNDNSGVVRINLQKKKLVTKANTSIVNEETTNNSIAETKQSVKLTPQKVNKAAVTTENVAGIIPEASVTNNDQQKNYKNGSTPVAVVKQDSILTATTKTSTNKEEEITPAKKITTPKNKKQHAFFFTISTGPDVSFSGSDKLGTTKLLAGAGLGFTFKDRLTVKTGFYTGRKIYSASPGEYHPPANFWTYYPYLQKVDADCKVFEIPVSLSYNFGTSAKQNWFASTGLSSYLMKKEVYNYYYKQTAAGQTMNRKWTVDNENKHYFSVLTLSGGYQRNIGKNIFVSAEPYIKLPLSGVGYGKVKLNSGGILFSIGIKPFNSTKK